MTTFAKAVSYLRISRDRTGEELGIQRQRDDIQALADQRHITLHGEYADNNLSATRGRARPQYAALLAAVDRGDVDAVLVWSLSRLWRSRRERAEGIETFRDHRVAILCCKGPDLDLSTAAGRLLAGLLGEVDSHEVEAKSERERRAMRQRVQRGLPAGSPRPYGYVAGGRDVVPGEAADVKAMFAALLAGESLSGIAAGLNARGRAQRSGRPWSHNAVRHVLRNPRYASLRSYEGALHPGSWPALIDADTFHAAQHVLTDPNRVTSPGPRARWLLSGIAECGRCDDGTKVTSGSRGAGQPLYRCSKPVRHLARATAPIDLTVTEYAVARLSRPDAAGLLAADDAPDVEGLRATAGALRGRLKGLAAAFADDDAADLVEYREATRRIRERLAEVEARLAHPVRAHVLADLVEAPDVEAAWGQLGLDRRRAVVDALIERVTILPGRPGRAPFDPSSVVIVPREGAR